MKKKDKDKNSSVEAKNFIFEKWPGHLQVFFNGKECSFLCNPKSTFDELTACSAFFTSEIMRLKTLAETAIQVTETPAPKKAAKKKEAKKPAVKKPEEKKSLKKLFKKKEKKK